MTDSEEWFDVVDAEDRPIGRALREEVHRRGLRHRAAHILLFDRQGRVFLQKRSRTKDMHPGVWDSSAAGHLDAGESYEAAAARELAEELGADPPPPLRPLFKLDARPETGWEFVWVYQGEAEGPFRLHPEEIEEGRWFAPEEVDRWIADAPEDFAPSFLTIWRRFREGSAVS